MEALAVIGLAIPSVALLVHLVVWVGFMRCQGSTPDFMDTDQVSSVFLPAIMFMALGFRVAHGRFPQASLSEAITFTLVIAMGSFSLGHLVHRARTARLDDPEQAVSATALATIFGVVFAVLVGVGNPDW